MAATRLRVPPTWGVLERDEINKIKIKIKIKIKKMSVIDDGCYPTIYVELDFWGQEIRSNSDERRSPFTVARSLIWHLQSQL